MTRQTKLLTFNEKERFRLDQLAQHYELPGNVVIRKLISSKYKQLFGDSHILTTAVEEMPQPG